MNKFGKIGIVLVMGLVVSSCFNKRSPNFQYMPNMYEPVGYDPYGEIPFMPNKMEALAPPDNTVPRGWLPYAIPHSIEGKELARVQPSPLDSLNLEADLAEGKILYDIYCAICHGAKGDGQGNLVKREKILGVPSYADAGRDITVGTSFYTIHYGLNAMGSYANQLNTKEAWQVSEYVMKLKQDLTK